MHHPQSSLRNAIMPRRVQTLLLLSQSMYHMLGDNAIGCDAPFKLPVLAIAAHLPMVVSVCAGSLLHGRCQQHL